MTFITQTISQTQNVQKKSQHKLQKNPFRSSLMFDWYRSNVVHIYIYILYIFISSPFLMCKTENAIEYITVESHMMVARHHHVVDTILF